MVHTSLMIYGIGECSLGSILVAFSEQGICAISLEDDPGKLTAEFRERFPQAQLMVGDAEMERMVAGVIKFVEKPNRALDLSLDVRGTVFQRKVWQALREIPLGSTRSYAEVARQIGSPAAVRAVASACAANTIAVVIPCHRVVRSDGSLSGYRWGVKRKQALLQMEKQSCDSREKNFVFKPQDFAQRPGLKRATAGGVRRFGVGNFRHVLQAL